jgi:hypothetical protein
MSSPVAADPNSEAEFAHHVQTYRLFINGFKYGTLGVIAILIILAVVTL